MKTLTQEAEPELLIDAIKLLKSEFTELYVGLGYDRKEVGLAWHNLRVSPKGNEMLSKFPPHARTQARTFISDMKEEIAERSEKKKKKSKK